MASFMSCCEGFVDKCAPALLDRTLVGLIVSAAAFALVALARTRRKDA